MQEVHKIAFYLREYLILTYMTIPVLWLEFNKNFKVFMMNLKNSVLTIQDKRDRDIYYEEDHPTIADLMREQNVARDGSNTVHYRRDLDSLG